MKSKKRGKEFIGPASIWRRTFAFAIDLFIIYFIIIKPFDRIYSKIIPEGMTYEFIKIYFEQNPQLKLMLTTISFAIGILIVLYFSYLEFKIQQTPGKILLGLYIIADKDTKFWNYMISNITFIPVVPFVFLWIIDPIHMFLSPKNQRFMEKINRIMVVQKYKF